MLIHLNKYAFSLYANQLLVATISPKKIAS